MVLHNLKMGKGKFKISKIICLKKFPNWARAYKLGKFINPGNGNGE